MSAIKRRIYRVNPELFREIIMFSAWGFALALASFLFLWIGKLLDDLLGTSPKFMLGLFSLAIIGCFVELYQGTLKILKKISR